MKQVKPERSIDDFGCVLKQRTSKLVFSNHELFESLNSRDLNFVGDFYNKFFTYFHNKGEQYSSAVKELMRGSMDIGRFNNDMYDAVELVHVALERQTWIERSRLVFESISEAEDKYRKSLRLLGRKQALHLELVKKEDSLSKECRYLYDKAKEYEDRIRMIKVTPRYSSHSVYKEDNELSKERKVSLKSKFRVLIQKNEKIGEDLDLWIDPKDMERLHGMDCHYCGLPASESNGTEEYRYNGIDRKDSSRGYIKGNVVSCCRTCNTVKMDKSYEEFIAMYRGWAERVLDKTK